MSITSSPPPDASGTARGLVNLLAQTFAGVKTFAALLIASAGVQLNLNFKLHSADGDVFDLTRAGVIKMRVNAGVETYLSETSIGLRAKNGANASDVGVRLGTTMPDASVNADARLAQWSTGIGGTEVVKAFVVKSGTFIALDASANRIGLGAWNASVGGFMYRSATAEVGMQSVGGGSGIFFNIGSGVSRCTGAFNAVGQISTGYLMQLNTNGNARPTASAAVRGSLWYSKSGAGVADTVEVCLKSAADTYSWVTIATG